MTPLASQARHSESKIAQQPFFTQFRLESYAGGTYQDDTGDALAFKAFNIPACHDGLVSAGKFAVTIPAASFTRAAYSPQSLMNIHGTSLMRDGYFAPEATLPFHLSRIETANDFSGSPHSATSEQINPTAGFAHPRRMSDEKQLLTAH